MSRSLFIPDGGGGSQNPALSDGFKLSILASDSNSLQSDVAAYSLTLLQAESVPVQTESVTLTERGLGDVSPAPIDARLIVLRSWCTGATSNDAVSGNTVAPASTNGPNDGVFCNCTTGTGTADTTNPVTVTSGSMNVPAGVTVASSRLRLWFKVAAIAAASTDTFSISMTATGLASQVIWAGPVAGTVAYPGVDYSAGTFTFDTSALTLAQLQSIVLTASYTATVVLVPQTSIKIDAWAVDITSNL